jgi:hypothetical protein
LATHVKCFFHMEKAVGSHWIRSSMGSKAGLDTVTKRTFSISAVNLNPIVRVF